MTDRHTTNTTPTLTPEREAEIRTTHPGDWYAGPWYSEYVDGQADEPAYYRIVHQESGTTLATLPDWAGLIALFVADAHDAVPVLLAELDRVRAERDEHDATKTRLEIPSIVCICGSTRFMQEMADADRELTWAGHIVIKPGCDMKTPHPLWADPVEAEAGKARLDGLHRAKIRKADEVLVVGDYIGDSTRAEIAYARSLGKPVKFTHPAVDPGVHQSA